MTRSTAFILLFAALSTACEKKQDTPTASSAAAPGATGTAAQGAAPATNTAVSAASIDIKWTGKWQPGDAPTDEFPLYSVKNNASAPLTYMQIWHYFYDKDKKQVGREFRERYQMSIAPGATQEIGAGPKKSELPKGTEHIEAVVTGANFGSDAVKFRDPAPPEQRPFAGK